MFSNSLLNIYFVHRLLRLGPLLIIFSFDIAITDDVDEVKKYTNFRKVA